MIIEARESRLDMFVSPIKICNFQRDTEFWRWNSVDPLSAVSAIPVYTRLQVVTWALQATPRATRMHEGSYYYYTRNGTERNTWFREIPILRNTLKTS